MKKRSERCKTTARSGKSILRLFLLYLPTPVELARVRKNWSYSRVNLQHSEDDAGSGPPVSVSLTPLSRQ